MYFSLGSSQFRHLIFLGLIIPIVTVEEIVLKPCNFGSVVSDPWNCRYYFHCTNGKLHRYFCGRNAVFDSSLGACVTDRKAFGCLRKVFQKRMPRGKEMFARPNDEFSCSEPGFYSHPQTCKLFYRCTSSKKLMFSCPNGLLFDSDAGRCDIPENVPSCAGQESRSNFAGSRRVIPQGKKMEITGTSNIQQPTIDDKGDGWDRPGSNTGVSFVVSPEEARQAPVEASQPDIQPPPFRGGLNQAIPRKSIDVRIPLHQVDSVDSLGNINIYLDLPNLPPYKHNNIPLRIESPTSDVRQDEGRENTWGYQPGSFNGPEEEAIQMPTVPTDQIDFDASVPEQPQQPKQPQDFDRPFETRDSRQDTDLPVRPADAHNSIKPPFRSPNILNSELQYNSNDNLGTKPAITEPKTISEWGYETGEVVDDIDPQRNEYTREEMARQEMSDPSRQYDGGKGQSFHPKMLPPQIQQARIMPKEQMPLVRNEQPLMPKENDPIPINPIGSEFPEIPEPRGQQNSFEWLPDHQKDLDNTRWIHRREYPSFPSQDEEMPDELQYVLTTPDPPRPPPPAASQAAMLEEQTIRRTDPRSPLLPIWPRQDDYPPPQPQTTLPPIQITQRAIYTDSRVGSPRIRVEPVDVTPSSSDGALPEISTTGVPSTPSPTVTKQLRKPRRGVLVKDGKEECLSTGVHPDPSDCTRFYQCGSAFGKPYHVKCNGGLVFSRRPGICDWPYKVRECQGSVPRLLPRRLLSLISEKKVRRQDAKILYPTANSLYEPYAPVNNSTGDMTRLTTPAPRCIPESYRRDQEDCQKFYICDVKSMEHVFLCPPGLAFDDNNGVCVSKEKVQFCQAPPTPEEKEVIRQIFKTEIEDFQCPRGQDLFSHDKDCRMFYDCDEFGYARILFCPEGFVFNDQEKFCDFPDNVPLCDMTTGKLSEPTKEDASPRTKPIEGRESYAFGLPPHMYRYDMAPLTAPRPDVKQIDPARRGADENRVGGYMSLIPRNAVRVNPKEDDGPAPLNFVCRGPGRYSHPYDCDKFFVCGSGRPELGRCPRGLVFDSMRMTCAFNSAASTCNNSPDDKEPRRKGKNGPSQVTMDDDNDGAGSLLRGFICPNDGLYPDRVDCRKFYHCSNGIVAPYYCDKGMAFNVNDMACVKYEEVALCNQKKMTEFRSTMKTEKQRRDETLRKFGANMGPIEPISSAMETLTDVTPNLELHSNLLGDNKQSSNLLNKFQDVTTRLTGMPCEREAIYLDPRDCRKFYHCHQKMLYQNVCPLGMLFNRKRYICDDYRKVLDCLGNIAAQQKDSNRRRRS